MKCHLSQPAAGGPSVKAYDAVKKHFDLILERFKEQRGG
jgi:hypothetical protein